MRQLKILLILLTTFTSVSSYAENATLLSKGEKAPYSGILMPEDKVQTLRKNTIELENLKVINDSLNTSLNIYKLNEELLNKKISTLNEQNDKLADNLMSARSTSTWERIGYFALGALLTGTVSYGIYKAAVAH